MNQMVEHYTAEIKERREFARRIIEVPVRYKVDMKGEYLGFVHNISYGGMLFESKQIHKLNDKIQAELNVELYGKLVIMHGYVIRTCEKCAAVKFTHVDKNDFDEVVQIKKTNPETNYQRIF